MCDYIGCFYSEGYINPEYTFVFNHEDIEEVIFVGFIDEEEEAFVGLLN
ncbi:cytoplasmic protein [Bacillus thuringiensis]|uniref:Cytoplasmic protein n=1 Tax=Bacillus thuringiensis TaxID=1428 RepID=A0A9X6WFX1_BACTU|nr:cytoplasmic protein [Bacillus thuringiensis]PFN46504.1 cytoplasmic protein [Bacillus thuringiensis]PFV27628.1 cytoplasmic protein [Bacillus thuringiensis]